MNRLSHFDDNGNARMVNVSAKQPTLRRAAVEATFALSPEAFKALMHKSLAKGDAFTVAKIAALQAAKRTDEWFPLAHSLPIEHAEVSFKPDAAASRIRITATVTTTAKTGIEMEAFVAASAAALALYDMVKAVDPAATIQDVRLLAKTGGKQPFSRSDSCAQP